MKNITVGMIKNMQHCIGFEKNRVTGSKHRVMRAYRNYYVDHKGNKNWNDLIELGLADRSLREDNIGIATFYLTIKGFEFLAELCGFEKIIEID